MLELKNVDKTFHAGEVTEHRLFRDFSLTVHDGEFVSVVGSNGSGKTTLLNLVCGSLFPDRGSVFFDGKDVTRFPDYRRYGQIGRVWQDPTQGNCPHLTVAENLALAENKGKSFGLSFALRSANAARYRELLASLQMGLEEKLNVKVGSLSGGQRQALSLLMVTMTPLKMLILDEHTAALDPKAAQTVMELTDRIVKEKHLTALMVTHNLRYAAEYGNRLLMLHKGEIVLEKDGAEKAATRVDDLLGIFNSISVECGN